MSQLLQVNGDTSINVIGANEWSVTGDVSMLSQRGRELTLLSELQSCSRLGRFWRQYSG